MDAFHLTTSVREGVVTVAVAGELDIASRELLRAHLFQLMDGAARPGEIVLELGALTFIDAAGLGALVAVHQRARQREARLKLTRVPPMTARLMRITGLDEYLHTPAREQT
ncbi:STAS domain-containing protein [Nonomuraea sp. NPDC048826]|uniref:STAS domain-containing protein n=1 Tax=Nonomuraea sp. NPDC048826 TaxID=3364347 RepID=UPI0037207DEE